ncbi:MerR family transcriptional regulator [Streptacidiphilus fuscans]|uniref:MerR family transcriptional regulator n=1 Tax=Streptacidiphilus fuscans TaxID=2789292 RepID=A0A931FAU4_9ACTN|nr:MerR family transcriptional regulator [Streptacidiphilus fuscans]MBF9067997.1 MerR family transcriptional regulator [Streptacidiphilus fuscans]
MSDELLTIGAFARRARLSPKALRLYDDLGLLPPVRVDPQNGYRYYAPAQLEQARLVAWLRLLGMPLARIQTVCALPPAEAATEVAAYWARVEDDTASRRRLAAFLVDHLNGTTGKDHEPMITKPLTLCCAAASDTGLVRESNQDTAYAGPGLLAVADGFGPAGALAGSLAVEALKPVAGTLAPGQGDVLNLLTDAVAEANRGVEGLADAGSGTTLTALLWTGSTADDAGMALVHVGDSRAYLLRDGELFRITQDHSHVQSLVDEGRLTADEAATHPQRALLTRALDGRADSRADLTLQQVRVGDRYLLCSDGLSAVIAEEELRQTLINAEHPDAAVRELVVLARRAGGPDNVACAVADVAESGC